ncbi:hypothetical protein ACFL5U_04110, partial [Candidatus Margulisiibacteriota bacterium]
ITPDPTDQTAIDIQVTAEDLISNITKIKFTGDLHPDEDTDWRDLDPAEVAQTIDVQYSLTLSTGDANKNINISLQDEAGNDNDDAVVTLSIELDEVPLVLLQSDITYDPLTQNTDFPISVITTGLDGASATIEIPTSIIVTDLNDAAATPVTLTFDDVDTWTGTIPISQTNAPNDYRVTASDALGNQISLGLSVQHDALPPTIDVGAFATHIITADPTDQTTIDIKVEASDTISNITQIKFTGDLDPAENTDWRDLDPAEVAPSIDIQRSLTLATGDGPKNINVYVIDEAGNDANVTLSIELDQSAPDLTDRVDYTTPTNQDPFALSVDATGIDDIAGISVASTDGSITESLDDLDGDGIWTADVDIPRNQETSYTITATDLAGNPGTADITVLHDDHIGLPNTTSSSNGILSDGIWYFRNTAEIDFELLDPPTQDDPTPDPIDLSGLTKLYWELTASSFGSPIDPVPTSLLDLEDPATILPASLSLGIDPADTEGYILTWLADNAGNNGAESNDYERTRWAVDADDPIVNLTVNKVGAVAEISWNIRDDGVGLGNIPDAATLTWVGGLNPDTGSIVITEAIGNTTFDLDFGNGTYSFTLTVVDQLGYEGQDAETITYQAVGAPVINEPAISLTRVPLQVVSGTVDALAERVRITLNDNVVGYAIMDGGNWHYDEEDMVLIEGLNTIKAEAQSIAGDWSAPAEIEITLDTIPPLRPEILTPTILLTSDPTVFLSGTMTDDTVEILINGSSDGVSYPDSTHWEKDLDLAEGINTIDVVAQDEAGNPCLARTIVITKYTDVDAPTITSPSDGLITNNPTLVVEGTRDPALFADEVVITFTNSADETVEESIISFNNEIWTSSALTLTENANTVQAKQKDEFAPDYSETSGITVILDTELPEVSIAAHDSVVTTDSITLTGTASDNYGIASVTVNDEPVDSLVDEIWTKNIALDANTDNSINVVTTDLAGNTQIVSTTIYYNTPPEFDEAIQTPADG